MFSTKLYFVYFLCSVESAGHTTDANYGNLVPDKE